MWVNMLNPPKPTPPPKEESSDSFSNQNRRHCRTVTTTTAGTAKTAIYFAEAGHHNHIWSRRLLGNNMPDSHQIQFKTRSNPKTSHILISKETASSPRRRRATNGCLKDAKRRATTRTCHPHTTKK